MKYQYNLLKLIFTTLSIYFTNIFSTNAQIIPDGSLPQNSNVRTENNIIFIEGGTRAAANLYHSFQKFSLPSGNAAFFNNTTDIKNVISRVTGGSASNIDGLIKTNGTTNLFLINPSGIIFSENAKLDIGGSFIASTASSIDFGNGLQFSANKLSQPEPLLSINVPIGLKFAGISGVIKVQGAGHSINSSEVYSPLTAQNFSNGLQVKPGNTLALIGGNILLEGGIISTQNGKIELQSLAQGEVTIDQKDRDWILNNKGNQSFADITLLNNALVFAESNNGTANSINVQGKNVNVLSGSLIISQNLSQNVNYDFSRGIIFNNSGILRVQGESKFITSGIFTSNFGRIPGDNIEIGANQAEIEGAQIATTTFNSGSGGKIIFNTNYLKVSGSIPSIANPLGYGGINTFAYSSGNGGDISGTVKEFILENKGSFAAISSSRLLGHSGNINLTAGIINIKSGSSLGSLTFGNGNGGNVFINANNYINVTEEAISLEPSLIQAATFSSGNAGNLEINTPILFVQDGQGERI
ncbi:filamentous hemagglutinin N-terminal domain-containing protein [Nostoc sp. ChiQUE01b]|uniref:two-partner secretion domain-containing protein n=1 Tax=Nostoc sp. ChiQUE01b TaxID=3075376 RepID=UPI002AD3575A|nr:filamentous hemagglutinin N-terminal domain-containing protein [Nostoc sp. ChiQUE01b]MDZ8263671.1 filamentous hemagglutinin N-terminal domain-containing protein [Nostoc sp. ChiQUE01b]